MTPPNNLNEYLTQNYNKLVRYATKHSEDPNDLVHFIYMKAVDANFKYRNKPSADWYFKLSIKQSSFSDFNKLYYNNHTEFIEDRMEMEEDNSIDRRIMFEVLDEQIRFLTEFDRTVIEIYLRGENMKELSREADIPYQTIQSSIKRSVESIKKAIFSRMKEDN
jgi:DNA-directed RNA polymerase specialized sigma24 family protein